MDKVWDIRWTITAANDLEIIIEWLGNKQAAIGFKNQLQRKLFLLSLQPGIGNPSLVHQHCRKTIIRPYYILLYKIFENHIEVLRIFDGRQNPSKLQSFHD